CKTETGRAPVERARPLPLLQGLSKLPALLKKARFGDDGIHQVALIAHDPYGALEVALARIQLQRLLENTHALVQVRLLLHAPVGFGDYYRQALSSALLHIELQRLEE